MKVIKSKTYKVGIGGVRAILIDKQKAIEFEKGNPVEITEEQKKTLDALGWCMEVKNDSDSKNTQQSTENRVTATE